MAKLRKRHDGRKNQTNAYENLMMYLKLKSRKVNRLRIGQLPIRFPYFPELNLVTFERGRQTTGAIFLGKIRIVDHRAAAQPGQSRRIGVQIDDLRRSWPGRWGGY
uniref:Uncharacterized protein n=1 Tax=Romanomermis culicivorax TaxID=13658 RepID=A0A915HHD7_ROMCU